MQTFKSEQVRKAQRKKRNDEYESVWALATAFVRYQVAIDRISLLRRTKSTNLSIINLLQSQTRMEEHFSDVCFAARGVRTVYKLLITPSLHVKSAM